MGTDFEVWRKAFIENVCVSHGLNVDDIVFSHPRPTELNSRFMSDFIPYCEQERKTFETLHEKQKELHLLIIQKAAQLGPSMFTDPESIQDWVTAQCGPATIHFCATEEECKEQMALDCAPQKGTDHGE